VLSKCGENDEQMRGRKRECIVFYDLTEMEGKAAGLVIKLSNFGGFTWTDNHGKGGRVRAQNIF